MSGYSPDLLTTGLKVVFCGINPAATAAADGHNFSNRSNRFWTVLYRAGFTDKQLRPEDERELLNYGCGITAVVARPTRRASEITDRRIPKCEIRFRGQAASVPTPSSGLSGKARTFGDAGDT